MTRKPNFWKFIMALMVMALLFAGSLAITRSPRIKAAATKATAGATNLPAPAPRSALPQGVISIENVFEAVDGDVEDNKDPDPTGAEDWNNINPPTVGTVPGPQQFITGPAGNAQLRTFVNDQGGSDRIFTTGASKDFLDINTASQAGPTPSPTPGWQSTIGSVPDKDEIDQAYAAKYIDPISTDAILVFGATRHATNGDSNIGFWFYQSAVGVDTSTGNFTGFHKNGDLLLLSAFTGGGGTSTIRILEWVGSVPGNPGQLDTLANRQARCTALGGLLDATGDVLCDITGPGTAAEAFVNSANTTAVWPYSPKGKSCGTNCIPVGASFEGGINLTDLGLATECFSTFLVETRSSQSVSAVLKDFALGSFNTCVAFTCDKTVDNSSVCEDPSNPGFGLPVNYTFTFNNTGAVAVTVDLVDDNGTPGNTADDVTIVTGDPVAANTSKTYHRNNVVLPINTTTTNTGKFTIHSAFQADTTCTDTATVTVIPNPTASAGPNQTVNCVDAATTNFTLAGSASNGTHVWSCVSGDCAKVSITTPGALDSGVVFTGTGQATLRLTTTSTSCGTATSDVTLKVTPNVHVTINSFSCDANRLTVNLTATPTGGTNPTCSWSSGESTCAITNKGPGVYTVTVTDDNGCQATATRKVGTCTD